MANILISSLGTGNKQDDGYRLATYEYNNKHEKTPFVSKALTSFLPIDKMFLVGTKKSIWDSAYKEFGGEIDDIELLLYEKQEEKTLVSKDLEVVQETICNYLKTKGSKCFIIDYGINNEELWSNFDKYLQILDYIEDGDTVYIDITHAFRSFAFMSFLMVQFGHVIKNKNFKVGSIFYGMLEYSSENDGITPIVDLKIFYDLMEWIKAIDSFKNHSRADQLVNLLDNEEEIREVTKTTFSGFDVNIAFANMDSLQKFIGKAKQSLSVLRQSKSPIVKLLSDDIIEFIKKLDHRQVSKFQLELARLYYDNKNYALAFTVLVEALVSKECEKNNFSVHSKEDRKLAKERFYYKKAGVEISAIYMKITPIRNAIVHVGKREVDTVAEVKKFSDYLQIVSDYIDDKKN